MLLDLDSTPAIESQKAMHALHNAGARLSLVPKRSLGTRENQEKTSLTGILPLHQTNAANDLAENQHRSRAGQDPQPIQHMQLFDFEDAV